MTAAHDWFTYAPVTTLPAQLTAYPLHTVQRPVTQLTLSHLSQWRFRNNTIHEQLLQTEDSLDQYRRWSKV